MAMIHCKACGKVYGYEKHGCCPSCGAYNRPPRREQVQADGTVHHLTERDRSPLPHGDKVCYEQQTERSGGAAKAEQWLHRAQEGLGGAKSNKFVPGVIGLLVAVVISSVIMSAAGGGSSPVVTPEPWQPEPEPDIQLPTDPTADAVWMGDDVWAEVTAMEDDLCCVELTMADEQQLTKLLEEMGLYPELLIEDVWGECHSMYPHVLSQESGSWLLMYPLPEGTEPESGSTADLWFYNEDGAVSSVYALW